MQTLFRLCICYRFIVGSALQDTVVKITNCGAFNVYYLPALPEFCPLAWCFGDELPCGEGLNSADGYPPCIDAGITGKL